MNEPHVMIAIPSGSDWKAAFGMSLAFLVAQSTQHIPGIGTPRLTLSNTKGSILSRSRQQLVEHAQRMKCTHLLFLDSDMQFPSSTLARLLTAKKKIIAANCATKCIPACPTARLKDGLVGTPLYEHSESNGVQEVWRVGTGIMLIDMKVFEKIDKPYFPIEWKEELQDYVGEDWGFCAKAELAGIQIFVDHALSKKIFHVGALAYGHEHVKKNKG